VKVVILAGGYGTRLSEYTDTIPKPMVPIGERPILWHIMQSYAAYGYSDFFLALGYKSEVIKDYFLNYRALNSNFTVALDSGAFFAHEAPKTNWRVTLINTGLETMTGGRLRRMKSFIGEGTFLVTYGDGLADINIKDLVRYHRNHGKMVTVSAVRPSARFGELEISDGKILSFKEKPQVGGGWINGGFFVMESKFLDLITHDSTILEREPLERAAAMGELMAYEHEGFWQCMDTKRDRDYLETLWRSGGPPWIK